jgi:hypothetical protein
MGILGFENRCAVRRIGRRQLAVVLALLGLWLSGAVLTADAYSVQACGDDCPMHRLMAAHAIGPQECGAHYPYAALTVPCDCGTLHASPGAAPATLASEAAPAPSVTAAFAPAALPAVAPHLPCYSRFLGQEPTTRLTPTPAPAALGLRAPPR